MPQLAGILLAVLIALVLSLVAGTVLAALAIAGAMQANYWKNSEMLFMRSIAETREN